MIQYAFNNSTHRGKEIEQGCIGGVVCAFHKTVTYNETGTLTTPEGPSSYRKRNQRSHDVFNTDEGPSAGVPCTPEG